MRNYHQLTALRSILAQLQLNLFNGSSLQVILFCAPLITNQAIIKFSDGVAVLWPHHRTFLSGVSPFAFSITTLSLQSSRIVHHLAAVA
jgi:Ca2+/H+ antiporter